MPHGRRFANLRGVTALVVEDNDDSQEILAAVLAFCGARPVIAPSAERGLGDLVRAEPDVIICDLSLPGADGFQFIKEVRAREARDGRAARGRRVREARDLRAREARELREHGGQPRRGELARGGRRPAIAISGFHERFARPVAFRLGYDEYFEKPVNLSLLCRTVGRVLGRPELGAPRARGT